MHGVYLNVVTYDWCTNAKFENRPPGPGGLGATDCPERKKKILDRFKSLAFVGRDFITRGGVSTLTHAHVPADGWASLDRRHSYKLSGAFSPSPFAPQTGRVGPVARNPSGCGFSMAVQKKKTITIKKTH